MLRGATRDKILNGWYTVGTRDNRFFIIYPTGADTICYAENTATEYCWMLHDAGVRPLYRESEPRELP